MAALFQLSGSIKSFSHKQTRRRRNGNELPLQRPHRGCTIPTSSKPPSPGCFQRATNKLLGLGLLFDGSCNCRFWGGFSGRRVSHWIIQTKTPAAKHETTSKGREEHKGVPILLALVRAHKRQLYKEQVTYKFLIFFTKALTALTILLIRTCHPNNSKLSACLFIKICFCYFLQQERFLSSVSALTFNQYETLTCCFLYKRGMEKTAITAVQQR